MLKLLSVELLKIRRSLALLMMFAIPLMVATLNVLILLRRHGANAILPEHWNFYWLGNSGLWSYFMLPLYIALITTLLNGHEHKHQTWRLMLTLPVTQLQLFMVKGLLAWLFVIGASAILVIGANLGAGVLIVLGASSHNAFDFAALPFIAKLAITSLPVIAIQHAVSWRVGNLVVPLALGVIATMGITQIGGSSSWIWYPWVYSLMATNGAEMGNQQQALWLAAAVGTVLFAASAWYLGRREVEH